MVDLEDWTTSAGEPVTTPDIASPLYHLFDAASLTEAESRSTKELLQLRQPRHLSTMNGCLDQWFTQGTLCTDDIGPQDRLDLIYLWVNGSDPIWQEQYELTRELEFPERSPLKRKDDLDPPVRHYRSQGTLKYALRSGVEAFRRGESSWIQKMHVLTADMPIATDEEEDPMMADYRLGQIPDWLDKERVFQVTVDSNFDASLSRHVPSAKGAATARDIASLDDPPLQWHFHSEIFRDPIDPSCDASAGSCAAFESASDWANAVTPTFNSFAIETRMAWLDDLADCRYVHPFR